MNVVALAGGTGGAKLAHGLQAALAPGELTVVVNTGDDTERHGLLVMPDHDAVMYMLAGRFDDERGWGIAGETWTVMDALADYGEEAWFRLGDRDFATHIARTARLRAGSDLTAVVRSLQTALGIATPILPMADAPVRTEVRVDEGWLDFQEYFVHRHQAPEVREVRFRGDLTPTCRRHRRPSPRPTSSSSDRRTRSCRSARSWPGPSVIWSRRGPRRASRSWPSARSSAGPRSRGRPTGCWSRSVTNSSARGVARIYRGIATAFVLDTVDAALEPDIAALGYRTLVTDTIMADHDGRARLARTVLDFAVAATPAATP